MRSRPKQPPSPRTIQDTAASLQDYRLSPRRARVLAAEVDTLNRVVLDAARQLEFEDEPSSFDVVIRVSKNWRGGGKDDA
jgi:hypothetical protein